MPPPGNTVSTIHNRSQRGMVHFIQARPSKAGNMFMPITVKLVDDLVVLFDTAQDVPDLSTVTL
jgi:hypothetical protein